MECTRPGHQSARTNAALALGIASLLLTTSGIAYAAGTGLVLGRSNEARKTTELSSKRGEPLSLVAPAGQAPLAVNSQQLVDSLNADLLDGLEAEAFARADDLPPNLTGWTIMVAGSSCPDGSEVVGLGGRYGAEDSFQADFAGSYLYKVEYSPGLDSYVLRRNQSPLLMTACKVN